MILIQGDTLRKDHLDVYGYERPTAPMLRRLAEEGALFDNAITQTGWTKAETPSILTALYPSTHGVHAFADRLPASATTIAAFIIGLPWGAMGVAAAYAISGYLLRIPVLAVLMQRIGPVSAYDFLLPQIVFVISSFVMLT